MSNLNNYNLYAGVFNLRYVGTLRNVTKDSARQKAHDIARDMYDEYAGTQWTTSWDSCYEEVCDLHAEEIEKGLYDSSQLNAMADEYYEDEKEKRIRYAVVLESEDPDLRFFFS